MKVFDGLSELINTDIDIGRYSDDRINELKEQIKQLKAEIELHRVYGDRMTAILLFSEHEKKNVFMENMAKMHLDNCIVFYGSENPIPYAIELPKVEKLLNESGEDNE